jgi:hypothetical protein
MTSNCSLSSFATRCKVEGEKKTYKRGWLQSVLGSDGNGNGVMELTLEQATTMTQ